MLSRISGTAKDGTNLSCVDNHTANHMLPVAPVSQQKVPGFSLEDSRKGAAYDPWNRRLYEGVSDLNTSSIQRESNNPGDGVIDTSEEVSMIKNSPIANHGNSREHKSVTFSGFLEHSITSSSSSSSSLSPSNGTLLSFKNCRTTVSDHTPSPNPPPPHLLFPHQTTSSTSSSQCVASTGESNYELPSVDSGVSLYSATFPQSTPPDNYLLIGGGGVGGGVFPLGQTQTDGCNGREESLTASTRPMQTIAEGREESPSSSIPSSTSLNQQKLQSKVEALSLSNELLKTSLDDAKKQVALLQATVASQREEITTKESQINTINGRVSALLRGMESTDSSNMQYKELYHKSIQQNGLLLGQLNHYSRMGTNIQAFLSIHEGMSERLVGNKKMLDSWKEELMKKERRCLEKVKEMCLLKSAHQSTIEDCHRLRSLNNSLLHSDRFLTGELGKCLATAAVTSARFRMSSEEAEMMKENLMAQNRDLQGKFAHLLDSFKRAKDEFQESSEFAEMERQMLLETNTELEQEIKMLKCELQEGEEEFQKLVNYIKQFQEESTEKATILKSNLMKADKEIEDLDQLIDHVKLVLSDNLPSIKDSKPIVSLLQKLSGLEEPL